jgi:uncharacterized delta-60 repeat protein
MFMKEEINMMFNLKKIIILFIFTTLSVLVFADPAGSLDKTFNKTGMVKDSFPQLLETLKDVALQNDGKIVVSGYAQTDNGSDAFLARYTSDGKLDLSFNGKGYLLQNYDLYDYFNAVKVQSDGKIVAAGSIYSANNSRVRVIVCRFNPDGTPDASFNSTGYVIFSKHAEDTSFCMDIDPSGKIITGGYAKINNQFHMLVCRFSAGGALDASFANKGYYTTETTADAVYAVALQDDGKIITAGAAYSNQDKFWVLAFFALLSSGKPDTSFNKIGELVIPMPESSFYSLAISGNGSIVGGGYYTHIDEANFIYELNPIVFRINKNGVFDKGFNEKWVMNVTVINMENKNMVVTDIAAAPDGKIVFCGYQYGADNSSYDIFVVRYKSDGSIDYEFGQDGILLCDFGKTFEIDAHLAVTKNGSVIVAGNTSKEYRDFYNDGLFIMKIKP